MMTKFKASLRQVVGRKFPKVIALSKDVLYYKYYSEQKMTGKAVAVKQLADSVESLSYSDFVGKGPSPIVPKSPKTHAILEINTTCNIDCLMCKTSLSTRKKGKIEEAKLIQILDRYHSEGVRTVALHTIGDPLANPRLGVVFRELRKRKMRAGISTNGLLLHRFIDLFSQYQDVCSLIRFSIDGSTKPTYEKIRFGGEWEQLIDNMNLAKESFKKNGMTLEVAMVVSKDNVAEIGDYIVRFREYTRHPVRDMSFGLMNSLAPDTTYFEEANLFPEVTYLNQNCHAMTASTVFSHLGGEFSLCCRDYDGSLQIGSLIESTPKEIRGGDKLKEIREHYYANNFEKLPLCGNCRVVDRRINTMFSRLMSLMLFRFPEETSEFYQEHVNTICKILSSKEGLSENISKFVSDDLRFNLPQ
ncbi:MAG: radical SAM protein [Methylococcales bacterium]|nr:radical SAM protein [Methylococcales bacterium]